MDEEDKPFTDEEREALLDQMEKFLKEMLYDPEDSLNLNGAWCLTPFLRETPEGLEEQNPPRYGFSVLERPKTLQPRV